MSEPKFVLHFGENIHSLPCLLMTDGDEMAVYKKHSYSKHGTHWDIENKKVLTEQTVDRFLHKMVQYHETKLFELRKEIEGLEKLYEEHASRLAKVISNKVRLLNDITKLTED